MQDEPTAAASPATGKESLAPAAAVTATLGLAAGCWVLSLWQMNGMDMGVATSLGSFALFTAVWVPMMAAMMLPGAAQAIARNAAYRPHSTAAAGLVVIAAGAYELTPVKVYFRRCCRESAGSGWRFGLCCAGSSIGLMLVLVALGVMNLAWMIVIAVLVLAQKLMPPRAVVDLPVALAIIGFGIWILAAPN